jgi:tetratricopeptide (TPR) repeat protein
MHKSFRCLINLCLTLAIFGQTTPAFAITQEDRIFFEKVTKRKGSDEEILLLLTIADELEGNYAVLQRLKELQSRYARHLKSTLPPEAELWVYAKLAYHELKHGSKAQASTYCNSALASIKAMPEPIDLDGGYFLVEGCESLVQALLALKRLPDYNRTQTLLGHAKLRFGRRSTEKLMIESLLFCLVGDFESARVIVSDAIKADPGYSGTYLLRASLSFRDKKYGAALKDVDRALNICSDFPHAYILKGKCLFCLDKTEEALAALNKAVELSHRSDAYQVRALIKLTSDPAGAEADMQAAMKAPDVTGTAFSLYADRMMEVKNFDEAIKNYTRALEMTDAILPLRKAKYYYRRGLCYRSKRDADKAMADFKQAIALDPSRALQVKKLLARIDDDLPAIATSKAAPDKASPDKPGLDKQAADKPAADKPADNKNGQTQAAGSDQVSGASGAVAEAKGGTAPVNDEYKEYVAAFDIAVPTYRKGQYKIPEHLIMKSEKMETGAAAEKKSSFIIDAAPAAGSAKTGSDSGAIPTREKASAEPSAAAAETGAAVDPYLRYLTEHVSAVIESAPSARLSATFQIQPDGTPLIKDGRGNNMLTNVISRSAPFKTPPADRKNVFHADLEAGSLSVRFSFAEQ